MSETQQPIILVKISCIIFILFVCYNYTTVISISYNGRSRVVRVDLVGFRGNPFSNFKFKFEIVGNQL